MESDHIKCPKCGFEIEVGEALANKIAGDVESRIRSEAAREQELAVTEARAKERAALEQKLKEIESDMQAKSSQEIADLKDALSSKDKAMDEARGRELALIREKRDLEERRKGMELEFQYKLEDERSKLNEKYASEVELKLKERDRQIEGLRTALADAKRKSEQGSMETQGEVLELDLETNLSQSFPQDLIDPVPKGIRGADVIQQVHHRGQSRSGTIIWEAKNTKAWNNNWIEKLKDDQRELGANIAVLVSSVLPEGVRNFDLMDGVWVCSVTSYIPLAMALRQQIIQVAFARSASEGKSEKMEMVYQYLSGDEFRQKVEAIVETFVGMQEQLDKEKRAYQRIWKEREKQVQRIIENTAGMYGDIRGLIGSSVPEIKALSLDSTDELPGPDDD